MITLAIKKMINNKLLISSLFIGILVAVLISCTIPIYSQGISHRMLVTQLENYQNEYNISPGANIISCSLTAFRQKGDSDIVDKNDSSANVNNFKYCSSYLENTLYPQLNMPALVKSITLSTTTLKATDARDTNKITISDAVLKATDSYEDSIEIISGRMPENSYNDDCVEVIISRATQAKTKYTLNSVIKIGYTSESVTNEYGQYLLKAKIVGIFDYLENPYSKIIDEDQGKEFYCNYNFFYDELFVKENAVSTATWYFAGDYTKFDLNKTDKTIDALESLNNNLKVWGIYGDASTKVPPIEQYLTYYDNVKSVNVLLVLFYSPVLLLVVFFIFMISKFVVENDKNEISMLNSRGASKKQIILLYLLQGGVVALISVIISPLLAVILCNILGASSGFLEFGQKAPLKIDLSWSAIIFSVLAAILAVFTMLVPVYRTAGVEIVQQKRKKKSPIWITIAISVVAVLSAIIAGYAYYVLVYQQDGLFTEAGSIQPLAYIFLISFFLAIALLFILVYPFVLKIIVKARQTKWNPEKFSAFSRISRLESKEKFIVIFLTLTIAFGVFSSISARTLNRNIDSSTDYQYPCDIIADVKYYALSNGINRRYLFDNVEGVEATKIIKGNNPRINTRLGKSITDNVELMGINPDEFGNIITWDDDNLPHPMEYYLNELKMDINTCILSKNAAKILGVEKNDYIYVKVDENLRGGDVVSARIIDVIDAWPTYYPSVTEKNGYRQDSYLVILNNEAIDKVASNQEYKVWMNTDLTVPELKSLTIKLGAKADNYNDRVSSRLENIVNGKREQYLSDINSVRQATNGSLTLGFISVVFVCAVGFMIYWMISIKSRMLQIGTMRALGMSFNEVYRMVVWEEILICGAAIVVGIVSGIASGFMFSPLLQSAFTEMGQMPPYVVTMNFIDIIKLLVLIVLLIASSFVAANYMIKSIRATTAIKLGEE